MTIVVSATKAPSAGISYGAELDRHAGNGGQSESQHGHDAPRGNADQDADADHRGEMVDADHGEADTLHETLGEGLRRLVLDQPSGQSADTCATPSSSAAVNIPSHRVETDITVPGQHLLGHASWGARPVPVRVRRHRPSTLLFRIGDEDIENTANLPPIGGPCERGTDDPGNRLGCRQVAAGRRISPGFSPGEACGCGRSSPRTCPTMRP